MSDPVALTEACEREITDRLNVNAKKNVEWLQTLPARFAAEGRTLSFRFLMEPEAIEGDGRVERFVFQRTRLEGEPFQQRPIATGERASVSCGLVFTSIGYRGSPIGSVPFDERSATVPNDRGRVRENEGNQPGFYVTGWLKRGPTGIIGTNRADSIETVQRILEDFIILAKTERRGFETSRPHWKVAT